MGVDVYLLNQLSSIYNNHSWEEALAMNKHEKGKSRDIVRIVLFINMRIDLYTFDNISMLSCNAFPSFRFFYSRYLFSFVQSCDNLLFLNEPL